ncbi:hypothetical protein acdb102_31100 [Acidothermaceae bacterium B102]|nr:hypothetical protein acdb102_31100 [Acidothermaceae bacterium B102]
MTVNVKCSVDSGWVPVSTKAELAAFEDAHDACEGITEIDGSINDLPTR